MDDPTISPRRRRTRRRLVDAAIHVIARDGVAGATIEDITVAAELTRGAFYSNYSTKEELLLAVCEDRVDHIATELSSFVSEGLSRVTTSSPDAIDAGIRAVFSTRRLSVDWILTERQIHLHSLRHPELRHSYLELVDTEARILGAFVEGAVRAVGARLTVSVPEFLEIVRPVVRDAEDRAVARALAEGLNYAILEPETLIRTLKAFQEF